LSFEAVFCFSVSVLYFPGQVSIVAATYGSIAVAQPAQNFGVGEIFDLGEQLFKAQND